MPVIIPDKTLEIAGMIEREALIEIACHLFDKGKLQLWPAAQLAGMSREAFEDELHSRNVAIYRPTLADLRNDLSETRI